VRHAETDVSASIVKIGRVSASGKSSATWVELYLNKDTGLFFATVGEVRIEASTKTKAEERVVRELQKLTDLVWREVIVLREEKRSDREMSSMENDLHVHSASCSFTYMRRERAQNPRKKSETFEREHREEFEARVLEVRERALCHTPMGFAKVEARRNADEREKKLREDRESGACTGTVWKPFHGETEVELPYSVEAWGGALRIDAALRETQARLDQFVASATASKLMSLSLVAVDFKRLTE
jgi:hypothetical protein